MLGKLFRRVIFPIVVKRCCKIHVAGWSAMQHLSNCGGGQAEAEVESEAHTEAEAETKKRQRQRQKQRHRQTQGQRLRASHCGGTLEMYEKRIRPPQK